MSDRKHKHKRKREREGNSEKEQSSSSHKGDKRRGHRSKGGVDGSAEAPAAAAASHAPASASAASPASPASSLKKQRTSADRNAGPQHATRKGSGSKGEGRLSKAERAQKREAFMSRRADLEQLEADARESVPFSMKQKPLVMSRVLSSYEDAETLARSRTHRQYVMDWLAERLVRPPNKGERTNPASKDAKMWSLFAHLLEIMPVSSVPVASRALMNSIHRTLQYRLHPDSIAAVGRVLEALLSRYRAEFRPKHNEVGDFLLLAVECFIKRANGALEYTRMLNSALNMYMSDQSLLIQEKKEFVLVVENLLARLMACHTVAARRLERAKARAKHHSGLDVRNARNEADALAISTERIEAVICRSVFHEKHLANFGPALPIKQVLVRSGGRVLGTVGVADMGVVQPPVAGTGTGSASSADHAVVYVVRLLELIVDEKNDEDVVDAFPMLFEGYLEASRDWSASSRSSSSDPNPHSHAAVRRARKAEMLQADVDFVVFKCLYWAVWKGVAQDGSNALHRLRQRCSVAHRLNMLLERFNVYRVNQDKQGVRFKMFRQHAEALVQVMTKFNFELPAAAVSQLCALWTSLLNLNHDIVDPFLGVMWRFAWATRARSPAPFSVYFDRSQHDTAKSIALANGLVSSAAAADGEEGDDDEDGDAVMGGEDASEAPGDSQLLLADASVAVVDLVTAFVSTYCQLRQFKRVMSTFAETAARYQADEDHAVPLHMCMYADKLEDFIRQLPPKQLEQTWQGALQYCATSAVSVELLVHFLSSMIVHEEVASSLMAMCEQTCQEVLAEPLSRLKVSSKTGQVRTSRASHGGVAELPFYILLSLVRALHVTKASCMKWQGNAHDLAFAAPKPFFDIVYRRSSSAPTSAGGMDVDQDDDDSGADAPIRNVAVSALVRLLQEEELNVRANGSIRAQAVLVDVCALRVEELAHFVEGSIHKTGHNDPNLAGQTERARAELCGVASAAFLPLQGRDKLSIEYWSRLVRALPLLAPHATKESLQAFLGVMLSTFCGGTGSDTGMAADGEMDPATAIVSADLLANAGFYELHHIRRGFTRAFVAQVVRCLTPSETAGDSDALSGDAASLLASLAALAEEASPPSSTLLKPAAKTLPVSSAALRVLTELLRFASGMPHEFLFPAPEQTDRSFAHAVACVDAVILSADVPAAPSDVTAWLQCLAFTRKLLCKATDPSALAADSRPNELLVPLLADLESTAASKFYPEEIIDVDAERLVLEQLSDTSAELVCNVAAAVGLGRGGAASRLVKLVAQRLQSACAVQSASSASTTPEVLVFRVQHAASVCARTAEGFFTHHVSRLHEQRQLRPGTAAFSVAENLATTLQDAAIASGLTIHVHSPPSDEPEPSLSEAASASERASASSGITASWLMGASALDLAASIMQIQRLLSAVGAAGGDSGSQFLPEVGAMLRRAGYLLSFSPDSIVSSGGLSSSSDVHALARAQAKALRFVRFFCEHQASFQPPVSMEACQTLLSMLLRARSVFAATTAPVMPALIFDLDIAFSLLVAGCSTAQLSATLDALLHELQPLQPTDRVLTAVALVSVAIDVVGNAKSKNSSKVGDKTDNGAAKFRVLAQTLPRIVAALCQELNCIGYSLERLSVNSGAHADVLRYSGAVLGSVLMRSKMFKLPSSTVSDVLHAVSALANKLVALPHLMHDAVGVPTLSLLGIVLRHQPDVVVSQMPLYLHCVRALMTSFIKVTAAPAVGLIRTSQSTRGGASSNSSSSLLSSSSTNVGTAPTSGSDAPACSMSDEGALKVAGQLVRVLEELGKPTLRKQVNKYLPHLLQEYVSETKVCPLPRAVESIVLPGIYAIMDSCSSFEFNLVFSMLGNAGKAEFKRLHSNFMRLFKFSGNS